MARTQATSTEIYAHPNGDRFVRTDYKRRSKVTWYTPTGYREVTYRFNNLPFYEHAYLSWRNLHYCCHGDRGPRQYLLEEAVQGHHKLVADETLDNTAYANMEESALREALGIDDAEAELFVRELPWLADNPYYDDPRIAGIVRKGALSDFFDLDEVAAVYAAHGVDLSLWDDDLPGFFGIELSELYLGYNWVCNSEPKPFVPPLVTGLMLGYPVESTVSIYDGTIS